MPAAFQTWLERFPTAFALCFLSLGIVIAGTGNLTVGWWCLGVLGGALGFVPAMIKRGRKSVLWIFAGLLFFLLGIHLTARDLSVGKDFEPSPSQHLIHARVSSTLKTGPGFRVLMMDSGADTTSGEALPGKGRLFLRDCDRSLNAGDRIAFRARLRKPVNRGNPGEMDWETHCKNDNIVWLASVAGQDSVLVLESGAAFRPTAVLFGMREAARRFLEAHSGRFLDAESGSAVLGIQKGIILGDMGEISQPLTQVFADSGLAHALSASGLHVAIVALVALGMTRALGWVFPQMYLWLPYRKIGALVSIPAMTTYCLLVGARVPAVRATIMGLVVATAILLGRRWNSFNSLGLAALIILLIYPLSLFTPSFQLSFAAVVGILAAADSAFARGFGPHETPAGETDIRRPDKPEPPVRKGGRRVAVYLWALCFTSAAATLGIVPFLLQTFHSFPVYSLFANLASDLLLTVALGLGVPAALLGTIAPMPASLLLFPSDLCVWLIVRVALFFASLPGSTFYVPNMGLWEFSALCAMVVGLLLLMRQPSRRYLAMCIALAAILASTAAVSHWFGTASGRLQVVFLNVGKGDAAYVRPPGSRGVLIDSGVKTPYFDSGWGILIPFLKYHGRGSLDGLMMSHPEMDHMGGFLSVMSMIPSRTLWWNPIHVVSPHLGEVMDKASTTGVQVLSSDRTLPEVNLGRASIRFLNRPHPTTGTGEAHREVNNASVVARIEYGDVSFLFTGDLEREGEEELLASGMPLAATVLKVGHHGGKSSSTPRFLAAVKPRVAVISAEHPPRGGAPSRETLDRLDAAGIRVYWTGRDGAVTIETDGRTITDIRTGRPQRR